jgi:hypothetical protein
MVKYLYTLDIQALHNFFRAFTSVLRGLIITISITYSTPPYTVLIFVDAFVRTMSCTCTAFVLTLLAVNV